MVGSAAEVLEKTEAIPKKIIYLFFLVFNPRINSPKINGKKIYPLILASLKKLIQKRQLENLEMFSLEQ